MIKIINTNLKFVLIASLVMLCFSCEDKESKTSELVVTPNSKTEVLAPKTKLSKNFRDYWYNGEAEITSYKLEQERYGEIREGQAVLVFVTEDFLLEKQVKADNYSDNNTPILKMNATKNFVTGIYPYSIMQSTFYPVANNQHALKISASVQEWCGHVYTQLNNRDDFEVVTHSYFQGEADSTFNLEKSWTENELWIKLRIDPKSLPVGEIDIIPSLEYIRLNHDELKSYKAFTSLENGSYTISYEDLNRVLKINFNPNFPYDILGWEETSKSNSDASEEVLTTKATKLKTLNSDYWNKKSVSDIKLRETLKLQ